MSIKILLIKAFDSHLQILHPKTENDPVAFLESEVVQADEGFVHLFVLHGIAFRLHVEDHDHGAPK